MSNDHKPPSVWGLVAWELVFAAGMTAVWFATMILVPSAQTLVEDHSSNVPPYFAFAFELRHAAQLMMQPLIMLGCLLFIAGIVQRKKPKVVGVCQAGLMGMGLLGLIVGTYLLASAGVGMRMAAIDGMRMRRIYEEALTDFALLESAQNRYAEMKLAEKIRFVAVSSVDEFSVQEARSQVTRLIAMVGRSPNQAVSRRLLATLALFRGKMKRGDSGSLGIPKFAHESRNQFIFLNDSESRDVSRAAQELGAPQTSNEIDALEWIAQQQGKDGWEPLPLLQARVLP
jgi:hypothetical protein